MIYTKDEVQTIRDNLKKIALYCKDRYVPKLRKYDSLTVRFPMRDGDGHSKELTFGFDYAGNIWFTVGNLYLSFHEDAERNVYQSYPYTVDLMLNWKTVKRMIEEEMRWREAERSALMGFEV